MRRVARDERREREGGRPTATAYGRQSLQSRRVGTSRRQRQCHFPAKSPAAAGNQGDLASEIQ